VVLFVSFYKVFVDTALVDMEKDVFRTEFITIHNSYLAGYQRWQQGTMTMLHSYTTVR